METISKTHFIQSQATGAPFAQILQHGSRNSDSLDSVIHWHFGNGPMHSAVINTNLNVAAIVSDNKTHLLRSNTRLIETIPPWKRNFPPDYGTLSADYLFHMPDDTFIIVSNSADNFERWGIQACSSNLENASRWASEWANKYEIPMECKKPAPTFAVLRFDRHEPNTTDVEITRTFAMPDDTLSLLYGDGERALLANMRANATGTIIFQGTPGTGKTTLIRHLIDKLKETHRFYYLPVTHEELLASPAMVSFWAGENKLWGEHEKSHHP